MSTESSSTLLAKHANLRAALALNNTAITFLERGHVSEAMRTFKDSLELLRSPMVPPSASENGTRERRIEQKIQSCTALLARTSQQKNTLRSDIEIYPIDDDGDVSAMSFALQCMSSSSKTSTYAAFPLRLRCNALEKSPDLQAATVLYNVGVTHLIAYLTSRPSSSTHGKLLAGSLKNLLLAHTLFARNIQQENGQSVGDDAFQKLCTMLVSAMVLKNLFRVFQYQKQLSKAQQVLASLTILEAAVETSRDCLQDCTAGAAAA